MESFFLLLSHNVWIRLVCALVMGGMIGLERESHGRPAGFRTHILVCLGAVILIISAELLIPADAMDTRHLIAGRITAGIITGIGFLGAGVIVRIGDTVRGLTTAASIWFTAALGIIIGKGLIGLALVGTGFIILILTLFNKLDILIPPVTYRKITVCCDQPAGSLCHESILSVLKASHIRTQDFWVNYDRVDQFTTIEYHISARTRFQALRVTEQIADITGVRKVRWGV